MLFKVLFKPYPFKNPGIKSWKTILFFGIFIALFLLIFKPFGISLIEGNLRIYIIIGYGLVTMVILTLNIIFENVFSGIFNEKNWVVYKQILWVLWIIFTIGLGNLYYSHLIFSFGFFNLQNFIVFQFATITVAVLPVTGLILINQNKLLKQNVKEANSLNKAIETSHLQENNSRKIIPEVITLWAENNKENISFSLDNLYFIESLGNYIKVYYKDEDKITNTVLRSSLKRVNNTLNRYNNIFQCHRAYIVNISHIINITGNAQGYRLKLLNTKNEVPVSRSYIKKFNERIRKK